VEAGPGNSFAVTAVAAGVSLDGERRGLASFTVSNTTDQPRRGRAQVVPLAGADATWFTVVGDAARPFQPGATEQFPVQIAVPPAAPGGTASFRLDAVAEDNPDEDTTSGPTVTFEVPGPKAAAKRKLPWWIAALVAVVLVGVVVTVLLVSGGDDSPKSATLPPREALIGNWVNDGAGTEKEIVRVQISADSGDILNYEFFVGCGEGGRETECGSYGVSAAFTELPAQFGFGDDSFTIGFVNDDQNAIIVDHKTQEGAFQTAIFNRQEGGQ
jgi:hypothetical protein